MNTGAKIAIVSVIAVVIVITAAIASIAVGSINANRDRHNEECASLYAQINQDKTGLKAALGLNSDQINQEIAQYNEQCT